MRRPRTPSARRTGWLPLSPSPLQVWAVEDTTVQLTWGRLPAGTVTAEAHDGTGAETTHPGGPGALLIEGLAPGTRYRVRVRWAGGEAEVEARTLTPPPGELLARVATASDLHLGAERFGLLRTMAERRLPGGTEPHPLRCARAALDEARAWGAELVVLKGDVVQHRRPDDYAQAGRLLDSVELSVLLLRGNHEVNTSTQMALPAAVGDRSVPYVDGVASLDVAGLRLVGADTTVEGRGHGVLHPVADEVVERVASAPGPAMVLLHHQLQRFRLPTYWPPGVSGTEAGPFLDRLAAANPDTVVTSGHTHRNRARRHGPVLITEVGSTKDWPGVWAGYAIHEGGIRQVVRRVQAPEAIAWTEYSRRAVAGVWGQWSPGQLQHRCLVQHWTRA